MVVMLRSRASSARVMQLAATSPSIHTVHAEHAPAIATDLRAGETERVAQEFNQCGGGIGERGTHFAVDEQ